MKALSQSEYGELRDIYERVYAPEAETILEGFTDEDLDLTDEEIEEQVEEVFLECIEEGYDIDEIERVICEAIDTELEVLNEVTNPAKVAALRMKNQNTAAAGEGRGGDAGAKARARLNVSKQKVGGSSEKKASTLSRVKGAVKKVAKAAQGGVGLAARAVGTAQRAASAVKGAAKSGYERGRQGAGDTSSTSSTSSASGGSSSASGASSSDSSEAPKKRKDGLLKRAIKKVVRGVSKGVSAAAGAVKAGADSITDRARKESMNHTDVKTIQELYNSIYESQDAEQLDELSSKTLKSYTDKADADHKRLYNKVFKAEKKGKHKKAEKHEMKAISREDGISRALSKIDKQKVEKGKPTTDYERRSAKDVKVAAKDPSLMDRAKGAVKKALRKEELEATGLFTVKEIEAIMEAEGN